MPDKSLPKPELDLPLPEKELPSGEEVKSEPEIQETAVPIVKEEKSHRGISLLGSFIFGFLFVVLIVLVGGGAFFLGKNLKTENSQVVQTQVSAPSPTPDPTADWKTYEGDGFSFKYPSDWTIISNDDNGGFSLKSPNQNFTLSYDVYDLKDQISKFKCTTCSFITLSIINPKDNSKAYVVINSSEVNGQETQQLSLSDVEDYAKSSQGWPYVAIPNNPNKLVRWSGEFAGKCDDSGCAIIPMSLNEFQNKLEVRTAQQILSSFKFTDSSTLSPAPTGAMVACTMEAKLCPDGKTYVGRSGPKCEFAKCPEN